jgi:hypothetical protein
MSISNASADSVVGESLKGSPSKNSSSAEPPIPLEPALYDPMQVPLVLELHCQQTLRFSASDIAAMAGFHPFRVLPHLLLRLVYQGTTGYWLQQHDAKALGLTLVESDEEIWKSLADKSGTKTKKALEKALTGSTKTVQEAQQVKQQVVKHAVESGKLKPQEIKVLQDGVRHVVNTRFGQYHEDNALDQCEQKFGWEIFDRNTHILEWPFQKVLDNTVEPMEDAKPSWKTRCRQDNQSEEKRGASTSKRQKCVHETFDLTGDDDDNDSKEVEQATRSQHSDAQVNEPLASASEFQGPDSSSVAIGGAIQAVLTGEVSQSEQLTAFNPKPGDFQAMQGPPDPHPFFVIRGSVDGKREELTPNDSTSYLDSIGKNDDDDDSWAMKTVIVELKHRMNRLFHYPPLYEQIQAVAYCLMYRVNDADIVQVMRHEDKPNSAVDKIANGKTEVNAQGTKASKAKADRVDSKSKKNYESIVPFLKEAQAVGGLENRDPNSEGENSEKHRRPETPKENTYDIFANDGGAAERVEDKKALIGSQDEQVPEECKEMPSANGSPACDIVPLDNLGSREDPVPNDSAEDEEKESPEAVTERLDNTGAMELGTVAKEVLNIPPILGTEPRVKIPQAVIPEEKTTTRARPTHSRRLSMQTDRISLNDPILQHGMNWHNVVLPRLRSFAEAVYAIRRDDTKRYRLLIACSDPLGQLETNGWELLHDECPWLRSCDTAFNRRV